MQITEKCNRLEIQQNTMATQMQELQKRNIELQNTNESLNKRADDISRLLYRHLANVSCTSNFSDGGDITPEARDIESALRATRGEETRTHRFRLEAAFSKLVECKNCFVFYDEEDNDMYACRYHSCQPIDSQVWRKMIDETMLDSSKFRRLMYWRCCGKLSRIKPVGCVKARHISKYSEDKHSD